MAYWCQLSNDIGPNQWQVILLVYKILRIYIIFQSLHGQISGYQNLISALSSFKELYSSYSLGMLLQILGPTKEAISVQFMRVPGFLGVSLISFLDWYGFLIIWKTFFAFPGAEPNLTLKILTEHFCRWR